MLSLTWQENISRLISSAKVQGPYQIAVVEQYRATSRFTIGHTLFSLEQQLLRPIYTRAPWPHAFIRVMDFYPTYNVSKVKIETRLVVSVAAMFILLEACCIPCLFCISRSPLFNQSIDCTVVTIERPVLENTVQIFLSFWFRLGFISFSEPVWFRSKRVELKNTRCTAVYLSVRQ